MNAYLIIAGILGILGGVIHGVVGDRWSIAALHTDKLATHKFDGDVNQRFLRWFWQIGTVVMGSSGALLLGHGLELFDLHDQLLLYNTFLWLSITAIYLALALKPPAAVTRMPPGVVCTAISALLLIGYWL